MIDPKQRLLHFGGIADHPTPNGSGRARDVREGGTHQSARTRLCGSYGHAQTSCLFNDELRKGAAVSGHFCSR